MLAKEEIVRRGRGMHMEKRQREFEEEFEEYLRKKNFSPGTIKDYVRRGKYFKEFLDNLDEDSFEADEEVLHKFEEFLLKKGLKDTTVRGYLKVARAVLKMREEREMKEARKEKIPDEGEKKEREYLKLKVLKIKEIIAKLQNECEDIEITCEGCIFKAPEKELSARDRALRVRELLSLLDKELEYFKKGTPKDREIFREYIPSEEVGYITALIRVLFDEDKFERWILFSKSPLMRIRMRKNER